MDEMCAHDYSMHLCVCVCVHIKRVSAPYRNPKATVSKTELTHTTENTHNPSVCPHEVFSFPFTTGP